jgi:drug/metabolite transporter (DMT)-like permease
VSATPSREGFGAGVGMTLLAIFIWGTQLPIAKAVYGSVDGTTLSLLRYLVAIVGFAGVLLWREGVTAFSFDGHGRVATIAGAGMAASAILVFGGLTFTRPESAAIILALQPAVTALMQWGLYRRRPAGYTLLCMLVAFVGVLLVVTRSGETLGLGIWGSAGIRAATASVPPGADREWLGNLMVVVGMVGWVTYTVITSSLSHWSSARVSTLTTIPTLGFLFAAWLIGLPLGLTGFPQNVDTGIAVRLVYVSLFGALIAMLLWIISRRWSPLRPVRSRVLFCRRLSWLGPLWWWVPWALIRYCSDASGCAPALPQPEVLVTRYNSAAGL